MTSRLQLGLKLSKSTEQHSKMTGLRTHGPTPPGTTSTSRGAQLSTTVSPTFIFGLLVWFSVRNGHLGAHSSNSPMGGFPASNVAVSGSIDRVTLKHQCAPAFMTKLQATRTPAKGADTLRSRATLFPKFSMVKGQNKLFLSDSQKTTFSSSGNQIAN